MLDPEASIVVKKKDKEQAGLTTQPYRRGYILVIFKYDYVLSWISKILQTTPKAYRLLLWFQMRMVSLRALQKHTRSLLE